MRRTLSSLIIALVTLLAGLAALSFTVSRALPDPAQPPGILASILTNGPGRDIVAAGISGRIDGPVVSSATAEKVAVALGENPALLAVIAGTDTRAASVDTARKEITGSASLDSAARTLLDTAVDRAENGQPLVKVIDKNVNDAIASVRAVGDTVSRGAGVGAGVLFLILMVVGVRRDRILVQLGRWCAGFAAFYAVVLFGLPVVLPHLSGIWTAVALGAWSSAKLWLIYVGSCLLALGIVFIAAGAGASLLIPVTRHTAGASRRGTGRRRLSEAAAGSDPFSS